MRNFTKISILLFIIGLITLTSCKKDTNKVTNLTVNKSNLNLKIGETDSLIVTLDVEGDIDKLAIEFSSSNSSVFIIEEGTSTAFQTRSKSSSNSTSSKTYKITGNALGTSILTFKSDGKTYNCDISVDDQIRPSFTQGELWYFGDDYETEVSNNFVLYLGSAGINMDDLSGDGEVLFLELNTAQNITDSIPTGTYEMVDLDSNNFLAFTLVPAYVENDNLWGTWYFGKTTSDIVAGNVVVTTENAFYKIAYSFIDYYGNTISGTFNGSISYINTTQESVKKNLRSLSAVKTDRKIISFTRHFK